MEEPMDRTPKKLDVISLALELQSLESETFEIQDYADAGEMLLLDACCSSTSTCSSTTSTTSCCA
jgi:thiazolylpeptide-type bacteriocin precursor